MRSQALSRASFVSHVAKITGIAGETRYLADRAEVTEVKRARKFRSEQAAETAAKAHIKAFPPVIQRSMAFEIVPAATVR